jgi:hypothetical protein
MKTKVICPKCRAALKSAKELPPGKHITCPSCQTAFVVPGGEIAGFPPPAMGILEGRGSKIEDRRSTLHPQSSIFEPRPSILDPRSSRPRCFTWILVLAGMFLVLGGGALLVYFCFWEDKQQTAARDDEEDFQLPEPEFKPLPPRPLIPLSKAEQSQIDTAIGRGVAFLKKTQNAQGTWPSQRPIEAAALAGMTLLECGIPAGDPVLVKAAAYVRQHLPALNTTYGISLYLLFLNKLNAPEDKNRIQELALRLVMGQTINGGWSYTCPIQSAKNREVLLGVLRNLEKKTLLQLQTENGAVLNSLPPAFHGLAHLPNPKSAGEFYRAGGDNSNTQFALLALWAARSHKLPVDHSLELVVRRFRNSQNANGSWDYTQGNPIPSPGRLPTMTCAGLLALAVGYGLPSDQRRHDPQKDQAIDKAIKHLSKSIGGRNRGKPRMLELYFLWSVERVGVLYHLKNIADKEWYYWGMDILLANQKANGSWHAGVGLGSEPILDTCFALLFLQRANLAQDLTDKLQELLDARAELVAPPNRGRHPPPFTARGPACLIARFVDAVS